MENKITSIVLDKNYTIVPDAACWQLIYRKEGKINQETGKPTISRDQTFHANLSQALHTYIDLELRECSDLKEILDAISALEKKIDKAVGGIKRS